VTDAASLLKLTSRVGLGGGAVSPVTTTPKSAEAMRDLNLVAIVDSNSNSEQSKMAARGRARG
jgi:hypothetical protein